jgi:hypothetical protein
MKAVQKAPSGVIVAHMRSALSIDDRAYDPEKKNKHDATVKEF